MTVEQLTEEVFSWPSEARAPLADRLVASLDPAGDDQIRQVVTAIDTAIRHIAQAPECWRLFDEDIRRYLTRVFPSAILYTIEPEGYVLVVAVMHCRRGAGLLASSSQLINSDLDLP